MLLWKHPVHWNRILDVHLHLSTLVLMSTRAEQHGLWTRRKKILINFINQKLLKEEFSFQVTDVNSFWHQHEDTSSLFLTRSFLTFLRSLAKDSHPEISFFSQLFSSKSAKYSRTWELVTASSRRMKPEGGLVRNGSIRELSQRFENVPASASASPVS
jgi:hypothetical protein